MNEYTYRFVATCCNNQQPIFYTLVIERDDTLMVERIVEECAKHQSGFHEDIADQLFAALGGKQTITAHHHGVDVRTVRDDR